MLQTCNPSQKFLFLLLFHLNFSVNFFEIVLLLCISSQCFLHAIPYMWRASDLTRGLLSVAGVFALATTIAVIESLSVKLRWTKLPEFIAYAVAMSIFCVLIALSRNMH